jgi:hypothetical protein
VLCFQRLSARRKRTVAPGLLLPNRKVEMRREKPEDNVKLTYDIFRRFAQDGPIWIETVQGIETCKSRLLDLVQRNPGEYFAFDPLHSRVVANSSNTQTL